MAAPVFPFPIPRRYDEIRGRWYLPRDIGCRRCAIPTAWDGEGWRHVDGTLACVDPEALYEAADAETARRDLDGTAPTVGARAPRYGRTNISARRLDSGGLIV